MNEFDNDFILTNNVLLLSQYTVQPSYVPEARERRTTQQPAINDSHKKILMVLFNGGQYKLTVTQVCRAAGFPAGTGSRIVDACVKRNLIKIIQVPFGRGRPKYPVLLPDGYALLGVSEKTCFGRGAGYEHTLYQNMIAEHFKNFNTAIELNRNGKCIDVAIETNEFLLCIEVAMTPVNEKTNVEKDFDLAKAHAVLVACINEKTKNEVKKSVHQMNRGTDQYIIVLLISEILKMKPERLIQSIQPRLSL